MAAPRRVRGCNLLVKTVTGAFARAGMREARGARPRAPVPHDRTGPPLGGGPARVGRCRYFFALASPPSESEDSTAMNASCGTSTLPTIFMRFLPSFCFSRSLRLREMSPP